MKIKPIGNRILIKPKKAEEKTQGGIYIPESAKESKNQGTVMAIGQTDEKNPIKEGDIIIYETFSGTEIESEGEKYLLIDNKDILAILE